MLEQLLIGHSAVKIFAEAHGRAPTSSGNRLTSRRGTHEPGPTSVPPALWDCGPARLADLSSVLGRLKAPPIPSMAEDVRTDLITALFRTAGSRKCGFSDDSFVLIGGSLPQMRSEISEFGAVLPIRARLREAARCLVQDSRRIRSGTHVVEGRSHPTNIRTP